MLSEDDELLPSRLSQIVISAEPQRISTGIPALDNCLAPEDDQAGGIPVGASVLLSGAPGGGKSTLSLLIANQFVEGLILHGEESESAVKRRWQRLGLNSDPYLCALEDAEEACQVIRLCKPELVVIDSIQMVSLEGSRKRASQTEAMEMMVGQSSSMGASSIVVSHVNKAGTAHLGDNGMAHFVDIHLHMTASAKKGERTVEVRKNRFGRAGFSVPMTITPSGIATGAPTAASSLVSARSMLEKGAEVAHAQLKEGKSLTAYDYDETGVSASAWRAGLELAVRRMEKDGINVSRVKINNRMTYSVA